ncbi:MAG: CinA family protein [Bacilli bacterium]|nr:CinA family protein [Bacilli bacterium]
MIETKVVNKLIESKETISSMESCTAGYFATTITNVDGSSNVLKFSAITYSNEYKIKMGVKEETINKYSVYSFEVTHEMSKCISNYTSSTYGIGISGKINRYDEFNPGGSNNEIYATIYNSKNNEFTDIKIIAPNKPRKECKKFIVNKVLDELIKII